MNVRAAAAQALAPVFLQDASLDASLDRALAKVESADQALLRQLCFGVCRHYFALASSLNHLLSKALKRKDSDIKALLMVGIYQLAHMRVPDHAAINETVNGAKTLKKIWAKNLINGVLRQYLREREALATAMSEHHNHPLWLAQRIRRAWPQHAGELFIANNHQGPLTLRVNQRRGSRSDYLARLEEQGLSARDCAFAPQGLQLAAACDVSALPGFAEGDLSVQDEAAQLSAELLQLSSGLHVLDACCAPGGKTCHIAECEPALGRLLALDHDARRLQRVEENLARLGLSAEVVHGDAQYLERWWDNTPFDRILLDAPCSATGVIRRHPDIKLLRRDSDIAELCKLQGQLLNTLWTTLKPGGLLLYATCSILPEENELQVKSFVEQHPEAIHLAIEAPWGQARPCGRQLLPQRDAHDGFYYALLQKAV